MRRTTNLSYDELDDRLEEYWSLLLASQLADKSIEDYYYFAAVFVRWLNGEYEPGGNVR